MAEPQPSLASQAALSSARLQHFNYLAPAIQVSQPQPPSRQQITAAERRHYSFDTDTDSRRFSMSTAAAMDYDQTEGLGGLSVSSYDSVEDDRSPIEPALHGYPYHGKFRPRISALHAATLCLTFASFVKFDPLA